MSARYVRGNVNPVFLAIATAQAVAKCDLVGLSSNTIVRAEDTSWASAIATPSAPTVADGGVAVGSGLTNAATGVKISYQFPWGEGALSAAGTATPTANAMLKVSGASLTPPAPALYTNVYVETAAGSGTYKLWDITFGQIVMAGYGAGQVPAAGNPGGTAVLSDATTITQYNFAVLFAGVSAQTKTSTTVARIFGNSTDNILRVNSAGIFEFDCTSATYQAGNWLAPAKQTGNLLESQKLAAVVNPQLAVAMCVEPSGASATKVVAQLLPKVLPYTAGVQPQFAF